MANQPSPHFGCLVRTLSSPWQNIHARTPRLGLPFCGTGLGGCRLPFSCAETTEVARHRPGADRIGPFSMAAEEGARETATLKMCCVAGCNAKQSKPSKRAKAGKASSAWRLVPLQVVAGLVGGRPPRQVAVWIAFTKNAHERFVLTNLVAADAIGEGFDANFICSNREARRRGGGGAQPRSRCVPYIPRRRPCSGCPPGTPAAAPAGGAGDGRSPARSGACPTLPISRQCRCIPCYRSNPSSASQPPPPVSCP